MELNKDEKIIISIIVRSRRKLSTSQVSGFSGFNWPKTKKLLNSVRDKTGLVSRQTLSNRIYWFVKKDNNI